MSAKRDEVLEDRRKLRAFLKLITATQMPSVKTEAGAAVSRKIITAVLALDAAVEGISK